MKRRLQYKFPLKVDIGCKTLKKKGFQGIDILDFGQEIVWDVTDGLPLPDNTVQEIYCSHFLEHLRVEEIQDFFLEMYRVCKDNSRIVIKVPHADHIESYYSCHFSRWNEARISGIVRGLNAQYPFSINKMYKKGIELIAILVVKK